MHRDQNSSTITDYNSIPINVSDVSIISSTKDFSTNFFSLIKHAKKRIFLYALYLENDTTGKKVLDALYEAKEQNPQLEITIIIDFHRAQRGRFGEKNSEINAEFYQQREDQSSQSINFYGIPVKKREFLGVMHLKGFIFDNTVLYSGASINNVYFYAENKYRNDRYTLIKSQLLADCMINFALSIKNNTPALIPLNKNIYTEPKDIKYAVQKSIPWLKKAQYYTRQSNIISNLNLTPLIGFGRRGNKLNKNILDIIRKAKKEVILYTPYFNLPSSLKKVIKKMMKKNIKITLIVGDKTSNDFYIHNSNELNISGVIPYFYELLLKSFVIRNKNFISDNLLKIMLWKHENNSFHVKGVTVDKQFYLLTGNNLNPRAWGLDLENAILFNDKNHQLKSMFDKEHADIIAHTKILKSESQLDSPQDYPPKVRKILTKIKRFGVGKIVKRFL